ncbi:MAG: hypothetical protein AB2L24_01010 [Mangrovibacterium sp.]
MPSGEHAAYVIPPASGATQGGTPHIAAPSIKCKDQPFLLVNLLKNVL